MVSPESLVLAALALVACASGAPDQPVPSAPPRAEAPVLVPVEPAVDAYVYNPIGKRDPYRAFFPTRPPGPEACGHDPVQCFAVEQLTLTGVVWGERPRALLEDPSGGSHVVELGSYVGNRWGKVTHIERGAVVVTEEYLSGSDALVVHPIRLNLGPLG